MWRLIISAPDGWDSGPGFESKLCCTVTVFVLFCCRESVLRALLNRGAKPDCLSLPARRDTFPELGTPQHCRDNVTMFSDHTVVGYSNITLFVVATTFRHRALKIFRILSCIWSSITLSRCRCRKAYKLSRAHCPLPSSGTFVLSLAIELVGGLGEFKVFYK